MNKDTDLCGSCAKTGFCNCGTRDQIEIRQLRSKIVRIETENEALKRCRCSCCGFSIHTWNNGELSVKCGPQGTDERAMNCCPSFQDKREVDGYILRQQGHNIPDDWKPIKETRR